jgi:RHS repeat-associated protein
VTDAYDSLGRVIEEAQTIGGQPTQVVSSAWRADALRKSLTYPNGRVDVYTYDGLDRLKTVSDQGAAQPIAVYDYIGADRVLERLYPQAGTVETHLNSAGTQDIGYDGMRRTIAMSDLRSNGTLVVDYTYTYDRMGNRLQQLEPYDPVNDESYTYDSAYRLLTFHRAQGGLTPSQSSWTLDGVGNLVKVDGVPWYYSSTNALIQQGSGPILAYDNNGNQTDDGASYLYTYDALNRLRTVSLKSTGELIAIYSYDAMDRRIQKVVTNSGTLNGTTDYYLDGEQEIEEHNGAGALIQQYVFGNGINEVLVLDRNLTGGPTATAPGDQRLFYYRNALGSVMALSDTSGHILEAYQYDAYGRQTVFDPGPSGVVVFGSGDVISLGGASAIGNPFLFAGMRLDPETGLYFDRERYQSSDQGRFLSRDSIGPVRGDINAFDYAFDNPADLTDPLGLQPPNCAAERALLDFTADQYVTWQSVRNISAVLTVYSFLRALNQAREWVENRKQIEDLARQIGRGQGTEAEEIAMRVFQEFNTEIELGAIFTAQYLAIVATNEREAWDFYLKACVALARCMAASGVFTGRIPYLNACNRETLKCEWAPMANGMINAGVKEWGIKYAWGFSEWEGP